MTVRAVLALLAATCIGCHGSQEPAPPAPPAPPASTPPAARAASGEPEACRSCHAAEVESFLSSAHRLAARRADDSVQPPHALFGADAPIDEMARKEGGLAAQPGGPPRILVADTPTSTASHVVSHVLGGRRREDFLSTLSDGPHVLPLSWSVTRAMWTSPLAEEIGESLTTTSPLWWTTPQRLHESACSRCHPQPQADAPAGMSCSTCHGNAAPHVAAKSGHDDAAPWATGMRHLDAANLQGCGICHATGKLRPRANDTPLDAPLTDFMLPLTLAGPGGFDVNFMIDGRPAVAHGLEVQALAQSPCFLKGGATCTTCHDPHGGSAATSLRAPDPDAACRTCHAAIAADAAGHAKHAVATSPVPLARREPSGPRPLPSSEARAPGCVDCHAPADIPFGRSDMARDHAIGLPDPAAAAALGVADACVTCHLDRKPEWLIHEFQKRWPDRGESARLRRGRAFASAVGASADHPPDYAALRAVLEDGSAGPWLQASAAQILARTDTSADTTAALGRAWATTQDPVLAIAAIGAYAADGGEPQPLRDRMGLESDWRIKLSAAAGLSAREDPQGLTTLDGMHDDQSLPAIARADAGVELGTILIHRHSCKRAESLLAEVLEADPASVPAWLNMGVARACQGDAKGAREAFERVLELAPGHMLARANLAALEQSLSTPQ